MADRLTEWKDGKEMACPMEEAVTICAGDYVCANAAGYSVPGADTAGLIYQGVSREAVSNSAGADGDATVLVRRKGLHKATFATGCLALAPQRAK